MRKFLNNGRNMADFYENMNSCAQEIKETKKQAAPVGTACL
jgi:hypothetical protein